MIEYNDMSKQMKRINKQDKEILSLRKEMYALYEGRIASLEKGLAAAVEENRKLRTIIENSRPL